MPPNVPSPAGPSVREMIAALGRGAAQLRERERAHRGDPRVAALGEVNGHTPVHGGPGRPYACGRCRRPYVDGIEREPCEVSSDA